MTKELYAGLALLGGEVELHSFVDGVLSLLQRYTSAEIVYMAVGPKAHTREPVWSTCRPLQARAGVLDRISHTLIQHTLARGQCARFSGVMFDERFSGRESVRRNQIDSVLCAPIGSPAIGVVYLQSRLGGSFTEEQKELVREAATLIEPTMSRLLRRAPLDGPDHTAPFRQTLSVEQLVGTSAALASVMGVIKVCAEMPMSVLLTGPSGTGKSTVARALHENSGRSGAFVTVECTLLTAERLSADLFGALAGSYTGINTDRAGLVEEAANGTLFLDEVGTLSSDAQGKLLRFLEEGRYRWLGDIREREGRQCAHCLCDQRRSGEGGGGWTLSRGPLLPAE